MGKKIFAGLCSGLMLVGIVLIIMGYAFGGRIGSYTVYEGNWTYINADGHYVVGPAPAWMENFSIFNFVPTWRWGNYAGSSTDAYIPGGNIDLPAGEEQIHTINLNLGAGYLTVQQGSEFSLTIDGPGEAYSRFDGSTWFIEKDAGGSYSTRTVDGRAHYFRNGKDITTDYVLTLPRHIGGLSITMDIGQIYIGGLDTDLFELETSLASVAVSGLRASYASFETDLANLQISGFEGDTCVLETNLGKIDFTGDVRQVLEVNCALGTVTASVPRPTSYGYLAEGGLSSISIDGQKVSSWNDGTTSNNEEARPFFDIECDLGTVKIHFT